MSIQKTCSKNDFNTGDITMGIFKMTSLNILDKFDS